MEHLHTYTENTSSNFGGWKKYMTFFRMRFFMGLQYRTAAIAGMTTQFFWGTMEILLYHAFYEADAAAFPMSFRALASYIWLQQAFLMLFGSWMFENEIFDAITGGNLAYELCRPVNIYDMWFSRSIARRFSRVCLRCLPILLVAALLPEPYGMTLPVSALHGLLFIVTIMLSTLVVVACTMLIYVLTFYTISPMGLRMVYVCAVDFMCGAIIPLPFLPDGLRRIIELLPFASMQNVPLRVYGGSMSGEEMVLAICLQIFWIVVLIAGGRALCARAMKKVVVQGG